MGRFCFIYDVYTLLMKPEGPETPRHFDKNEEYGEYNAYLDLHRVRAYDLTKHIIESKELTHLYGGRKRLIAGSEMALFDIWHKKAQTGEASAEPTDAEITECIEKYIRQIQEDPSSGLNEFEPG